MSDSHVEGDTRYLFKRDKTWWVKVAVPRTLRDELGYDLRRSLQTHDLDAARTRTLDDRAGDRVLGCRCRAGDEVEVAITIHIPESH